MEISRRWITAGAGLGVGLAAALAWRGARRAHRDELATVAHVDLERYAGRWFEIARYPTPFQKRCAKNTTAEYALRGDGRLRVENRCTDARGRSIVARASARVVDRTSNAKLAVRFAPLVPEGDYWIVELDREYRYALVGEPKRRFVWMLARTPHLDEDTFSRLCVQLREHGYDPERLIRTPQD